MLPARPLRCPPCPGPATRKCSPPSPARVPGLPHSRSLSASSRPWPCPCLPIPLVPGALSQTSRVESQHTSCPQERARAGRSNSLLFRHPWGARASSCPPPRPWSPHLCGTGLGLGCRGCHPSEPAEAAQPPVLRSPLLCRVPPRPCGTGCISQALVVPAGAHLRKTLWGGSGRRDACILLRLSWADSSISPQEGSSHGCGVAEACVCASIYTCVCTCVHTCVHVCVCTCTCIAERKLFCTCHPRPVKSKCSQPWLHGACTLPCCLDSTEHPLPSPLPGLLGPQGLSPSAARPLRLRGHSFQGQ